MAKFVRTPVYGDRPQREALEEYNQLGFLLSKGRDLAEDLRNMLAQVQTSFNARLERVSVCTQQRIGGVKPGGGYTIDEDLFKAAGQEDAWNDTCLKLGVWPTDRQKEAVWEYKAACQSLWTARHRWHAVVESLAKLPHDASMPTPPDKGRARVEDMAEVTELIAASVERECNRLADVAVDALKAIREGKLDAPEVLEVCEAVSSSPYLTKGSNPEGRLVAERARQRTLTMRPTAS